MTTLTVRNCPDCPWGAIGTLTRCCYLASKHDGQPNAADPPAWCPLRREPVEVRLAVAHGGPGKNDAPF